MSKNKNVTEDGYWKEIWFKFINPLIDIKPSSMSLMEFLEQIVFLIDEREITRYQVKEEFQMPGLLCVRPNKKVQGVGYRKCLPGAILWVRKDNHTKTVDVQWLQNGIAETVWQMTPMEWEKIFTFYIDKRFGG